MSTLTHFSEQGRARMVNVAAKPVTQRRAVASGKLRLLPQTLQRIQDKTIEKGDVLTVADVAAVMAAKRTSDIIPMCHSLGLSGVEVVFNFLETPDQHGRVAIETRISVHCAGQTGVEMEALTAVSAALLTIYDMCKAVDQFMLLEQVQLEEKHGGKHGVWQRSEPD